MHGLGLSAYRQLAVVTAPQNLTLSAVGKGRRLGVVIGDDLSSDVSRFLIIENRDEFGVEVGVPLSNVAQRLGCPLQRSRHQSALSCRPAGRQRPHSITSSARARIEGACVRPYGSRYELIIREQDYPSGRPALRKPMRKRSRSAARANGRLRRSSATVKAGIRRSSSSSVDRPASTRPKWPSAAARTA